MRQSVALAVEAGLLDSSVQPPIVLPLLHAGVRDAQRLVLILVPILVPILIPWVVAQNWRGRFYGVHARASGKAHARASLRLRARPADRLVAERLGAQQAESRTPRVSPGGHALARLGADARAR